MKGYLARRSVRLLLVTAVLLAVGGGIAYATIPDENGVIHGCRNKTTGQLRVIDTAANPPRNTCSSLFEAPLDWNQTGPQGPKGDKGDQGEQGIQGIQGPPGPGNDARAVVQQAPSDPGIPTTFVPFGRVTTTCNVSGNASVTFRNLTSSAVNLWIEQGTTGAIGFSSLPAGQQTPNNSMITVSPERWTFELSQGQHSAEVDVWAVYDGSVCKFVIHSGSDL